MNVLVWLHRDLRVHDHPALTAAGEMGAVLPLFVADPADWAGPGRSARQWEFVAETLTFARDRFAAAGAPLVVRMGDKAEILARLVARHGIGRIVSSDEPGAELRAAAGVPWDVWEVGAAEMPVLRVVAGVEPGVIPPARALRLILDRCPARQAGGDPFPLMEARRAAPGRSVAAMERAASRLSPHLAWGSVSMAEAAALPGLRRALAMRATAMREARTPPEHGNPLPDGWIRGETGLPFADACLRYLAATGWLPAPLREMVASVAVHLLGAGQGAAGHALARASTDFDPALLWQGMAAVRPCNPVLMGQRLDPQGAFLRRWLPELLPVPDVYLHMPWRWDGAKSLLGRRYPEPMADPASALRGLRPPVAQRSMPRRRLEIPGQLALAF